MKLCIFGATGRTGEELILQSLEKKYSVIAYVRHPDKLTHRDQITVVTGELNDIDKMTLAMKGCDAVLVALGNPVSNSSGKLFALAIPNIIEAMDKAGVKRLISLSALGVGATYENTRYPYRMGAKGFLKGNFADHEAGESSYRLLISIGRLFIPVHYLTEKEVKIRWLGMQHLATKCQEHRVLTEQTWLR